MGFKPGERIGNYRIEGDLGASGSALLFQAQHLVLPRPVIIKILRIGLAAHQPLAVQVLREACMLEAIAHPGVPAIYEAGCLQDHRPWFAFEAHSGPNLDAVLASGRLSVADVAALLRDIADILEHVHHRGVFHRGLRPNRIVITADRPYPLCISDWSDAIVHDATSDVPRSVPEAARSYVAPELLRRDAGASASLIDGRVDVFSLGVIAHRALTGGLPCAPGLGAEPYLPSHDRRPDAPRALTALIDSMLDFQRLNRPSASEVRASAEPFATAPRWQVPVASTGDTQPAEPTPLMPPEELAALAQRLQLRRPRWTPEIHYAEATHALDHKLAEGEGPDEFME